MTTEAKTLTWQEAYNVIEARPLDKLIRGWSKHPADTTINCAVAALALHLGLPITGLSWDTSALVAHQLGVDSTKVAKIMAIFDSSPTLEYGKARVLTYIQEQIDAPKG